MYALYALYALYAAFPTDTARTKSGLWYGSIGDGPPVVLVHGANLDSRSLAPLAERLAGYRVVFTDLRFHGRSADGAGPFSFMEDLIEVLDAAGLGRVAVVGHSLGAEIAIDLALARPERVSRLVVIAPAVSGRPLERPPVGFEVLIAALRRSDFVEAGQVLGRMPVMTLLRDSSRQSEVRSIVSENTRLFRADRGWVKRLSPPAAGRLAELTVPLLVLLGSADPTESTDVGRLLADRAPNALARTFPGCGHLVPLDCLDQTAAAVGDFLRQR